MNLVISKNLLQEIHLHGENAYPEEGVGLLLGTENDDNRVVQSILELNNSREGPARHNRYLITAVDMMRAENQAVEMGMDILGIFHSHPDHPNKPSEYDLERAMPWFSYLITSINGCTARKSCSWRLVDNRSDFLEENIEVLDSMSELKIDFPGKDG